MSKDLVIPKKDTGEILVDTCTSLIDAIGVIDPANKATWLHSVPQLFKTLRGANQLYGVFYEWKALKDAKRIAGDYHETEQHQDCLQELLESLDKDAPESIRFETLKKIFLIAATESNSNRDGRLPLQYMQTARSLSSGEILLLRATHKYAVDKSRWEQKPGLPVSPLSNPFGWATVMAKESGLEHVDLVYEQEKRLIEKRLLSGRNGAGNINLGSAFGLTTYGLAFCEYISKYDSLKEK